MKFFNHPYRYLFILGLGVYSYINTAFVEAFRYYGINGNRFYILLGFVVTCFIIWEGNRIAENAIKKINPGGLKLHPSVRLFIVSQLISFIAGLSVYYFIGVLLLKNEMSIRNIILKLSLLFSFRVNLFLQCLNAILFFLNGYKQKQLEAEELKRISTQAQLQVIQNQVNPHFLFNNLNVLSTLVLQKHEDANTFIEAFSSVYRYILKNRDTETVKLQSELDFIEPYIYLLKTRFGNSLHIELDIPEQYRSKYIVPAALQLLIENTIKHNIVSAVKPLTVRLFINEEEYLAVINNLQEKSEKPASTEFGLYNINQRFKLLSGKEIKIHKTGSEFIVAIPLLKEPEIKKYGAAKN
jgi:sensor histidine kinase YesM